MREKRFLLIGLIVIFTFLTSSFNLFKEITDELPVDNEESEEPVLIVGEFEYTNEFAVEIYFVEHAVGLLDMTGFVLRDMEWELPVESQVLGYMDLDADNNRASFRLALPALPEGQFNDVDHQR